MRKLSTSISIVFIFLICISIQGFAYLEGDFDKDGDVDGEDLSIFSSMFGVADYTCTDNDGDGWGDGGLCLGPDCNDNDPTINPGAPENCDDLKDNDCNPATPDCCDFDSDGICSDTDCDDKDPTVYPGANELRDGKDNDCDGVADEGLITAGDIIITEIMYDVSTTPDEMGEWFEVFNTTDTPINMRTWILRDQQGSSQEISVVHGDLIVPALGTAVFCNNSASQYNGGVICNYEYGFMQLSNTVDEIILEFDSIVVNEIWYDEGSGWPSVSGRSLNLDPGFYDGANNGIGSNWCGTPNNPAFELPSGDHGTPGIINPSCTGELAVIGVIPDNGLDNGGEVVSIHGSAFTGVTDVQFDGISCADFSVLDDFEISCTTPAHAVGDVDVTVVKGAASNTLANGYRFTGDWDLPIEWAALDRPLSAWTVAGIPSEILYGRVREPGITGDACPNIMIGQVGYGPHLSDPRNDPGWLWFDAVCSAQISADVDEYAGILTVSDPGTYSFTYRFSEDYGYNFKYGDFDPGTANGFSVNDLGTLTVW